MFTCIPLVFPKLHLFNYQTHVYLCNRGPYVKLAFVPKMLSSWNKVIIIITVARQQELRCELSIGITCWIMFGHVIQKRKTLLLWVKTRTWAKLQGRFHYLLNDPRVKKMWMSTVKDIWAGVWQNLQNGMCTQCFCKSAQYCESSLAACRLLYADSENLDRYIWMHRLIWVLSICNTHVFC